MSVLPVFCRVVNVYNVLGCVRAASDAHCDSPLLLGNQLRDVLGLGLGEVGDTSFGCYIGRFQMGFGISLKIPQRTFFRPSPSTKVHARVVKQKGIASKQKTKTLNPKPSKLETVSLSQGLGSGCTWD